MFPKLIGSTDPIEMSLQLGGEEQGLFFQLVFGGPFQGAQAKAGDGRQVATTVADLQHLEFGRPWSIG